MLVVNSITYRDIVSSLDKGQRVYARKHTERTKKGYPCDIYINGIYNGIRVLDYIERSILSMYSNFHTDIP